MDSPLERLDSLVEHSLNLRHQRSVKRISNHGQRQLLIALLLIVDVVTLAFAFAAAFVIRFDLRLNFFVNDFAPWPEFYFNLGLILVPVWIVLLWAFRLYDWDSLMGGTREYSGIFQASLSGTILVALAQ